MSTVMEPGYCYCSCHRTRGMHHNVPCCDGKCPRCGKYIDRGRMETHIADHEARIKEALKELAESNGEVEEDQ